MTTTSLDMGLVERFAGQVFGYYTGGMIAYMIDIGHRTGLFEAAAGFTGITVTSAPGDPLGGVFVAARPTR
jgi:hypothetical protein